MNRVLVLVQNGIRLLTAPTNTAKKARRNRQNQNKIVKVTNPTCEPKLAPRYQHLTGEEIVEIEEAEKAHFDALVEKVEQFGIYPGRRRPTVAAGESEAMVRVISAKFGGKTHRKDACESRSHELNKDRKRRLRRLNHPRNAALLAA